MVLTNDELITIGSERIYFGKYKQRSLLEIYFIDFNYLVWLRDSDIKLKKNIKEFLNQVIENKIEFEMKVKPPRKM